LATKTLLHGVKQNRPDTTAKARQSGQKITASQRKLLFHDVLSQELKAFLSGCRGAADGVPHEVCTSCSYCFYPRVRDKRYKRYKGRIQQSSAILAVGG
jgi:hypothetical protein